MSAPKFKITINGKETILVAKPRHILKSMREDVDPNLKDVTAGESGYRLAWHAAGTELSFESWIESLDDLEPLKDTDDEPGEDEEDAGDHLNPFSEGSPSSLSEVE